MKKRFWGASGRGLKAQNITPVKGAKGNFGTNVKLSGKLVFGLFFAKSSGGVQISVFPVNFLWGFRETA